MTEIRKYTITNESMILLCGTKVYRIKYRGNPIRETYKAGNLGLLSSGEQGGWIEEDGNLSHEGDCWLYSNAIISGSAVVDDAASIFGRAHVFGNALVSGTSRIKADSRVFGWAHITGDVTIDGRSYVYGDAKIKESYAYYYDVNISSGKWKLKNDAQV